MIHFTKGFLSQTAFVCHLWLTLWISHMIKEMGVMEFLPWCNIMGRSEGQHGGAISTLSGNRNHFSACQLWPVHSGLRPPWRGKLLLLPTSTWCHKRSTFKLKNICRKYELTWQLCILFFLEISVHKGLGVVDGSLNTEVPQTDLQTRSAFFLTPPTGTLTDTGETEKERKPDLKMVSTSLWATNTA